MSHDDQGQAGARPAQSTGFLFGAKEASHRRGVPRNQPKVSILVQQDQDHRDGRTEVIDEPTAASRPEAKAGEDHFSKDRMYLLSPSNLAIVGSLPTNIWEEDQGHYK